MNEIGTLFVVITVSKKQIWRLVRFLSTGVLALVAIYSVVYSYFYYETYKDSIWLNIETIAQNITLPIKLAQLSIKPAATELPIPVDGVVLSQIADTWGAARSEGRSHEGVDIFAQRNTPIYAAAPGYVVRVGTNNLGGTIVFTVGPGGVRYYYAHLEKIALGMEVGTPVTTDTVIGFVGNSGNAEQTPPHLHFGVYHNGPQNPYPLLVDRYK